MSIDREELARLAFSAPRIADTLSWRAAEAEIAGRHVVPLSVDEVRAIAADLEALSDAAFTLHNQMTKAGR